MIFHHLSAAFLGMLALAQGKVYFKEQFDDAAWTDRWVQPSKWKEPAQLGEWKWTAGKWYGDESDKGIQTSEDARFYGLSSKMSESFTNEGKDLVLQFSVKHEQKLDCGGAYIKLLGDIDQDSFGGETPYQIMFGPDICGTSNRRTHVIFHYDKKDENLLILDNVKVETDQLTHLYTLHVKADNTYEVLIDDKSVRSGSLMKDFNFIPAEYIQDPEISKPLDWVDEMEIPDPDDVKPAGWDDIPAQIPDPEAEKPDDWDDEEDGEWEAPLVANPDYKGEWQPKMIDNPEYKGEWRHPLIRNPDYFEDDQLHFRCKNCKTVGFELWQVKSGTIFDDIIVTDSIEEAREFAKETFFAKKDAEKEMFDKIEEERREKERVEREARRQKEEEEKAAREAEAGDEEEEAAELRDEL